MYKLSQLVNEKQTCVIRLSDGACIPFDPQNSDYIAYLAWLKNGGIPLPAENT